MESSTCPERKPTCQKRKPISATGPEGGGAAPRRRYSSLASLAMKATDSSWGSAALCSSSKTRL
jgi:hypothetical protein